MKWEDSTCYTCSEDSLSAIARRKEEKKHSTLKLNDTESTVEELKAETWKKNCKHFLSFAVFSYASITTYSVQGSGGTGAYPS